MENTKAKVNVQRKIYLGNYETMDIGVEISEIDLGHGLSIKEDIGEEINTALQIVAKKVKEIKEVQKKNIKTNIKLRNNVLNK